MSWRHNGRPLDAVTDTRVVLPTHGGLVIRGVRSSDAGVYVLAVADELECDNAKFNVFIECM